MIESCGMNLRGSRKEKEIRKDKDKCATRQLINIVFKFLSGTFEKKSVSVDVEIEKSAEKNG